ncbi:MAG: hypothetical protein KKA84_04475 [Bacteroidetes bacterium]|nr:hypothetical protein [Bacteroidota bacterium]
MSLYKKYLIGFVFLITSSSFAQSMYLENDGFGLSYNGSVAFLEDLSSLGYGFGAIINSNFDIGYVKNQVKITRNKKYFGTKDFIVYNNTGYVNIRLGREGIDSFLTLAFSTNVYYDSYSAGINFYKKIILFNDLDLFPTVNFDVSQISEETFYPDFTTTGTLSFLISKLLVLSPSISFVKSDVVYGFDISLIALF